MGLERNHSFTNALESTYGDGGSTPTAVPVFYDEALPEIDLVKHENPVYGGSIGRNKFFAGRAFYTMGAKFYLKTGGTAGTICELTKLLQIAGMSESNTPATNTIYSPVDTGIKSATIAVNLDGVLYTIKGARIESLTIPLEAGNPIICDAKIRGLYTPPAASALSAPTFADAAVVPPVCASMALQIGTKTYVIPKMTFDLKNVIGIRDSINAGYQGVEEIAIIGREWGGTMTVEVSTDNDVEWWTDLIGATELAVASTGAGSAGNRISFSTSTLQIENVKPTAYNGVNCYEATFRINKHATKASEFSLKMD